MKKNGFSLIELVTVMLLVAVLAVYAASRFLGPSQFETVAVRDALVAELRRLQQARIANQSCELQVSENQFQLVGTCSTEGSYSLDTVSLLLGGTDDSFTITLNRLGEPETPCNGGCVIHVVGEDSETVTIEPLGYIHGS